ncbi:uncharacterized protein ASCRUDRAFT_16530, partial [Ascoidea rubescens DSM 1968]
KTFYCEICNSNNHMEKNCPTIWRSYISKDGLDENVSLPENIFCTNCGKRDHFCDECPKKIMSNI